MQTHAQLVIADNISDALIEKEIKQEGADVRHVVVPNFGIDQARKLKEMANEKSWSGGVQTFIIGTHSITTEAQNALLKLFEEPPADTIFYLVVPHESILLATLRSRLFLAKKETSNNGEMAEEFLKSSYKERLAMIADLAKKDSEVLKELARSLGRSYENSWPTKTKRALLLTSRYVYNRGASKKMLLEELALSLPQK